MNTHPSDHDGRDISSSEDRCKCPQCKHQLDFLINSQKPVANIHLYRHLKKRDPPPIKKDLLKDFNIKPKILFRLQSDSKLAATPVKYKPDRSKEANAGVLPSEYHRVSQTQRVKPMREDLTLEYRRDDRVRTKIRSNYDGLRLAQISENPENLKIVQRHTPSAQRGKVDASPSCLVQLKKTAPKRNLQKNV